MNISQEVGALAAALAKAQGKMPFAKRDQSNPFFQSKYADLASVWEAIQKPLSENGLAVSQTLDNSNPENVQVTTILMHESGQYIGGTVTMKPAKLDPQGFGSCVTYARRYALMAIVGVAPEDDDGAAASGTTTKGKDKDVPDYEPPDGYKQKKEDALTESQADGPAGDLIRELAATFPDIKTRSEKLRELSSFTSKEGREKYLTLFDLDDPKTSDKWVKTTLSKLKKFKDAADEKGN